MSKQPRKLVDQSAALDDFFESLLRDVNEYEQQHNEQNKVTELNRDMASPVARLSPQINLTRPVAQDMLSNRLFETLPPVAPVVAPELKVEPAIKVETVTPVEPAIKKAEPAQTVVAKAQKQVEPAIDRLPPWSEHEFQALLFKVAGLTMAVPLVDLAGVVECEFDKVTSMPGHADFYLGLMNHLGKNVPLVDTARFVLPVDKLDRLAGSDPQERITRAVMINEGKYALACDEVEEVITLKPEAVRWRSQRTQRRWLAGTVIEHMCALIDADAFADLLASRASIKAFRE